MRNLQVLVNALANSNEQIVQFSNHVALGVAGAGRQDRRTSTRRSRRTRTRPLGDVKGFLNQEQLGADHPRSVSSPTSPRLLTPRTQ